MKTIDLAPLRERVEKGLISSQKHPTLPLLIWNYTHECQFAKAWDEYTLSARGLITDEQGNVVARSFSKFFNYEEFTGTIPDGTPKILEKVDGSLGIVFFHAGAWHIATRGSFTSEQAIHGQGIINSRFLSFLDGLSKDVTYLFEIVYPENRIVVDYGTMDDLVFLGAIVTETGDEVDLFEAFTAQGFKTATKMEIEGQSEFHAAKFADLQLLNVPNQEGFVLAWPNGFRLKIKFSEYIRLHRIVTETSSRIVWQHMKEGRSLKELIEGVPDEFFNWLKSVTKDLSSKYEDINKRTNDAYKEIIGSVTIQNRYPDKKILTAYEVDQIARAMKREIKDKFALHPDIEQFLLMKYDKYLPESIRAAIWDKIEPPYSRPFSNEV